jgi:stage II sporulation protein P
LKKGIPLKGGQNPCVLILHSHGSEAYSDQPDYRSGDTDKNIVRVGQEIAQRLNALGISTIHDTTMHDVTKGYNDSYGQAGAAIARYLEEYPTIQVVVDVHRDAVADLQGRQKAVVTEDGSGARMLFVMGTDKGDLPHENWQDNLAFAMQLHGIMEAQNPGLMRPISLRAARYNEHFTPCSILLEVGSAGNTMEQALYSAEIFANGLGDLIHSLTEESGG